MTMQKLILSIVVLQSTVQAIDHYQQCLIPTDEVNASGNVIFKIENIFITSQYNALTGYPGNSKKNADQKCYKQGGYLAKDVYWQLRGKGLL